MKTYDLKHPIKSATGAEIKSVTLREPLFRDFMRATEQATGEARQLAAFISILGELSPDDVGALKIADVVELGKIIKEFLPAESL